MSNKTYYGDTHTFTGRDSNNRVVIKAGKDETLEVNGIFSTEIRAYSGFYTPVHGDATTNSTSSWQKMQGTCSQLATSNGFTYVADGRLVYTGAITRLFSISYTIPAYSSVTGHTLQFGIAKNGASPLRGTWSQNTTTTASSFSCFSCTCLISLATNDYIEIFCNDQTGTSDITYGNFSLVIQAIY